MGISIIVPGVNWASKNLGRVTPTGNVPIQAIAILGDTSVINEAQYTANLFPAFTTQRGVTWSITDGSTYASIDQTGKVTAIAGAMANSVTIRATSSSNAEVWAEKTISVTAGVVVYYDFLQSDGNAYIVTPGFANLWGAKVIVRGTLNANNGYIFGCRYASNSTQARMASYQNGSGKVAALVGSKGFSDLGFTKANTSTIYRWVFECSSGSGQTDGKCTCYLDSNMTQKGQVTGATLQMSGLISIFTLGYGASGGEFTDSAANHGAVKFYGLTIESGGETIADYRPCTLDGDPAIHDLVTGLFYFNAYISESAIPF